MVEAVSDTRPETAHSESRLIRLLSYNIQAGVETRRYREYLTKSWKHLLPHRERQLNLNRIANLLHQYDVVGLQEVDSGSLRSGFVDQTEYLAHRAGFPYWYKQVNRSFGKFAQYSNGLLSRLRPMWITEHKLPGLPGRGAMLVEFETNGEPLAVCVIHLALGRRARARQLAYVAELVGQYRHLAVMGDFNCTSDAHEFQALAESTDLKAPSCEMKTFPSWRPVHRLDHILVSSSLAIEQAQVHDIPHSDHLPLSVHVRLPQGLALIR